jgi:hypothetical protein
MQPEDDEHVLKWTSRAWSSLPAASQSLPARCGYPAMQNARYTPRRVGGGGLVTKRGAAHIKVAQGT